MKRFYETALMHDVIMWSSVVAQIVSFSFNEANFRIAEPGDWYDSNNVSIKEPIISFDW